MEWVLFGIVVVFGAVGLGQVGRQRLLDATKPPSEADTEAETKPSIFAPQIDWEAHNPLRRRDPTTPQ